MAHQFRYSIPKFRVTLAVALALTGMVAWMTWMLLVAFGNPHAKLWTALAALVFFGFVSATMLIRFLRGEVVLAVYPTGLYDARHSPEPLAWDSIREIVLRQTESDFELDVYLWKPQRKAMAAARQPDFTIELASLDAPAQTILEAVGRHIEIRAEGRQFAVVPG